MKAVITPGKLRDQAEIFESFAVRLREVADFMEGMSGSAMALNGPSETKAPLGGLRASGQKLTRVEQIREFVRENPGKKRKEIQEETGIPAGTIDMALKEKNGFRRDDLSRWYLDE